MSEESYTTSISKILQDARGPLEEIEDFTPTDDSDEQPLFEPQLDDELSPDRIRILKLAALLAVMALGESTSVSKIPVGRALGTAWAQDHRLTAIGQPGLAHRRASRTTWR